MSKAYVLPFMLLIATIGLSHVGICKREPVTQSKIMAEHINDVQDVVALFPKIAAEIATKADQYMAEAKQELDAIIAIPHEQRTFDNTAGALDRLNSISNLDVWASVLSVVKETSTDKALRDAAHENLLKISNFSVDNFSNNVELYQAFKAYVEGNATQEDLDAEQQYYLDESMKGFKRSGLELPKEERDKLVALRKELAELSMDFSKNIAQDQSHITVDRDALDGLDDDFIDSLKKNEDGTYIVGVDYPTYLPVMDECTVEETRKQLYRVYHNRAHPANTEILKKIIAKRDELAKILGYSDYATLDLEEQMVKTPARADEFLKDLLARSAQKEDEEVALLKANLPESVTLTADGKFKPWDMRFIHNQYKKKHLSVDEQKIAEYFPTQNTIDELLDVYHQFLGVNFKEVPVDGLWHEDVRMIQMFSKEGTMLGYLMLDLHPRPNKYTHACHATIISGVIRPQDRIPAVSAVLANFPKSTAAKPSLLKRQDVETFFHEFGHAIHALFGATKIGSFSGTAVKRDFVEMPSQMLEEWTWDKDILRKVSKHYQTGQALPDEMIDKILAVKLFDTGYWVQRQSYLALISLNMFNAPDNDPVEIQNSLHKQYVRHIDLHPENHFVAAFGHLTGYSAKYYGYLWSKVFALDMFEQVKAQGLLNEQMGQHYIKTVIGRGGSADPNELLKDFLGREPRTDAFMRNMGLEA